MGLEKTPITTSRKPTGTFPKEAFPIYCTLKREGQEDKFLTSEELIVQTDRFMQRFKELLPGQKLPDTVFFLDKSARPVAYMFRRLFPIYYPGEKLPEIRFVNIGGSGSRIYEKD